MPNNLPIEVSSFVGRGREVAEVEALLSAHRLLTLTRPGGSGKTRLALAVASGVLGDYQDGIWLVELAPLSDPDLVARKVASVLRVREAPGRALSAHLEAKELLLVLDNCEHLIDACASLADTLLRSCAGPKILATSRERLGVAGERACLVPSLSSPDAEPLLPLEELGRHGAVRLFVERAKAVNSAFELSEKNAPWVARLCRRLEGIPLAVEFVAARAKVLSAEQILRRLEDPLKLLSAGGRTADPCHRTLRATLRWSYDLLSEQEQVLFGRLSVFAGGFTLETAEAASRRGSWICSLIWWTSRW